MKIGRLLYEEVSRHATAGKLSSDQRVRINFKCHQRIPADPNSDEYAEQDMEVLALRKDDVALERRIKEIVDSVVKEETELKPNRSAQPT